VRISEARERRGCCAQQKLPAINAKGHGQSPMNGSIGGIDLVLYRII
jgi:hypothetical protein